MRESPLAVVYEQKLYQQMHAKDPKDIMAAIKMQLADPETLDAYSGLRALDYLDILRDKIPAILQKMREKGLALHQESAWADPLREGFDNVASYIRLLVLRSIAIDDHTSVVLCDILSDSSGLTVLQDQEDGGTPNDYSVANLFSLIEQVQRMCDAQHAFANPTPPQPHRRRIKKETKQRSPWRRMLTSSRTIERRFEEI